MLHITTLFGVSINIGMERDEGHCLQKDDEQESFLVNGVK